MYANTIPKSKPRLKFVITIEDMPEVEEQKPPFWWTWNVHESHVSRVKKVPRVVYCGHGEDSTESKYEEMVGWILRWC